MKNYDDEAIGFETLLPIEVVELLLMNSPVIDKAPKLLDYPLDEHELAMAA